MSFPTVSQNTSNFSARSGVRVGVANPGENGLAATSRQYIHRSPMMTMTRSLDNESQRFDLAPPRHSRPLYWTIPLPNDDYDHNSSGRASFDIPQHHNNASQAIFAPSVRPSAQASSPQSPASYFLIRQEHGHGQHRSSDAHRPVSDDIAVELHIALASYAFPEMYPQAHAAGLEGPGRLVTRLAMPESATYPPVCRLTIISSIDGSSMEVHGRRSVEGGNAMVVVSDVLDAIETLNERVRMGQGNPRRSILLGIQRGLSVRMRAGGLVGHLAVGVP